MSSISVGELCSSRMIARLSAATSAVKWWMPSSSARASGQRKAPLTVPRHKTALSAADVRYFTDVDHHDHEALVATNRVDERGVGHREQCCVGAIDWSD